MYDEKNINLNLKNQIITDFLKNITNFSFQGEFSIFEDFGFNKKDIINFFTKTNLSNNEKNIEGIKKIFNDYEFKIEDYLFFFKNQDINLFISFWLSPHIKINSLDSEFLVEGLINKKNYRKISNVLLGDEFSKEFCFSIIQKYHNHPIEISQLVFKYLDMFDKSNSSESTLFSFFVNGCNKYDYKKMRDFYEKNLKIDDFVDTGNLCSSYNFSKNFKKNEELFILYSKQVFIKKLNSCRKFVIREENIEPLMKKIINTKDRDIINCVYNNMHKINWKQAELMDFLKKHNFELTQKFAKKLNK